MTKQDPTKLDLPAVEKWLTENLPGFEGPIEAEKFDVGQSNPTFRLVTPKHRYVLRRKPPGVLLKSAHAVDREFRVQKALYDTDVPVAKVHVLCEDEDVIGSMFYVMDEVDGRHFNLPSLPELPKEDRWAIHDEMSRVLAAIHGVDLVATGLDDYGPAGNYYERQIGRWTKQYRASETDTIPAMDELIQWLNDNIPEDDGLRTLAHGDYRIDNMLFEKNSPRVAAVLDWELSTTGHPYADVAAVIMQWSMPGGVDGRGLAGTDRKAEGLMTDEEFVESYCKRAGIDGIDRFGFYLAFAFFRMAAIIQGVYKRALDGNASNPERARKMGESVPHFAEAGLNAARKV
ncbi:phosphotransferase family protein [Pseudooceanicola batsensis HTCC2597]|uniref:Phosphotransferase family protein n=1 Tax=Pseudooceanicola batsensis (strain ATCC BAA-863 / DSM 15984 / KCTC 12145 / HTCC2597) TaxID=252305 RepID=A3TVZ9_PSEBH|nr:phosphotransferase family protein [Pseudooceanicola batsensis]EAQ03795.1 phosphotransferase family protein [Pseudooceanicola batsensis HTCC2597]